MNVNTTTTYFTPSLELKLMELIHVLLYAFLYLSQIIWCQEKREAGRGSEHKGQKQDVNVRTEKCERSKQMPFLPCQTCKTMITWKF